MNRNRRKRERKKFRIAQARKAGEEYANLLDESGELLRWVPVTVDLLE